MRLRHIILFFIFLGLALFYRIWMIAQAPDAFCFSTEHMHPDQAVILLMAKHILEKGAFPIFYYGQDWFGGVEAFVHALAFLVFGIHHWSIHIAPLFFFAGFCTGLFLLAHELFGVRVALWTLAACIFSPIRFSEYSVMPHGGYIDAPMFGTILLWLAVRVERVQKKTLRILHYAAMGLVGGLGWWASPMMIYYLGTTALFILVRERKRGIKNGIFFTLPFFFLGALPFFYFYATDPHSQILGMGFGYHLANVPQGLAIFFSERLPQFLDLHLFSSTHEYLGWFGFAVYTFSFVFFLFRERTSIANLFLFKWAKVQNSIILFILFMIVLVVLVSSVHIRRGATQYLIPLASLLPIVLGYSAVYLFSKKKIEKGSLKKIKSPWGFAFPLLCIGLFLIHFKVSYGWVTRQAPHAQAKAQGHIEMIQDLEKRGLNRVYVDSDIGSEIVNFYSREKVISSRIYHERYLPYQEELEASRNVSFLGTHNPKVSPWLGMIGGKCNTYNFGPFFVDYNFQEPPYEYRQIAIKKVKIKTSEKLKYARRMLDRDLDTFWTNEAPMSGSMWIEFDLGEIHPLGMIRLWNKGFDHPNFAFDVSVEVSSDGQEWHEVLSRNRFDFYYWSGPRIYYWEFGYRSELRFGPTNARYLRIKAHDVSDRYAWKINEVFFYKIINEKALSEEGEKEILRAVSALNLKKIYADRWMSAKVREVSQGVIETIEPFTKHHPYYASHVKSRLIEWGPKVGFILENADADAFENQMRKESIELTRKNFKRWVLFYFSNWGFKEEVLKEDPGWWWMGLGVVKFNHKKKSEYLRMLGEKSEKEGKLEEALGYYQKAVWEYPNHIQARFQAIDLLKKLGKEKEANQEKSILFKKIKPRHVSLIQVEKGV